MHVVPQVPYKVFLTVIRLSVQCLCRNVDCSIVQLRSLLQLPLGHLDLRLAP